MDGDRKKSPSKSLAEIKAAARAQQRRSPKKQPPGDGSGDASVDDLAVEMVGMSLSERTKAPMPDNKVFVARGKTGVAFDARMGEQHRCWADPSHSEKPERVKAILERISGTLETHKDSIKRIEGREDQKVLEEDIKRVHTEELFKLLAKTPTMTRAEMRDVAEKYDSVYFDEDTCELALTAADLTISLVDAVIRGDIQNGMAIVRPPGHHAMPNEFNGFCFLNNVAIAANRALHVHGLKRILVVDWDVHHGQGIQRAFYNDPRVLYFSTHRYERAKFWPHLKESDYDSVGEGTGKGYTVNFPLDQVGVGDADFLAIWYRILLPVAYEYDPDLVIVSAGYDAALGCPEGQMRLTPEAYAHLVKPLMGLAGGKIAVVLEGGYCLDSLAESAYHTLNTLIGVPCPLLSRVDGVAPSPGIEDMIHRSWSVLKQYWKCFSWLPDRELSKLENFGLDPTDHFITESEPYEKQEGKTKEQLSWMLKRLKFEVAEKMRAPPKDGFKSVGVVHDSQMLKHIAPSGMHHPEKPERLTESWESLKDHGLRARCRLVRSRPATELELRLVHTAEHLQYMEELGAKATTDAKFCDILNVKSLYACSTTDQAAKLAAGSCLQVLEAVLNNDVESAFAIVRPPGHHAEPDAAFGFCFYNNVAVMAAYALRVYNLKRVLIIDWDVHHGNGIQSAFYSDPRVLYISVHRFGARFFPASPEGNYDHIGEGPGVGFNVNVPWNADGCRKKFGAPDYLAAFLQIVMPIAYEFDPELVLVSSGFDALERDPVEEKVCLFPDVFAHLTHLLSPLARGKVVMALEGGYRIDGVGLSVARCVSTLLGDPLPRLSSERVGDWTVNPRAGTSLRNVASVLNCHWKNLKLIGLTTSMEKPEPATKE